MYRDETKNLVEMENFDKCIDYNFDLSNTLTLKIGESVITKNTEVCR